MITVIIDLKTLATLIVAAELTRDQFIASSKLGDEVWRLKCEERAATLSDFIYEYKPKGI